MDKENILIRGSDISATKGVLILIHGRGGSAEDIMSLTGHLNVKDFTFIAPQNKNNSWYPFSFMATPEQNQPYLNESLKILEDVVSDVKNRGINSGKIFFLGFSQGACLMLEFITRNAQKWGGAIAFTGGLIGDKIYTENYKGNFKNTPIYIGTSDPDPHVPVSRVQESERILKKLNANVRVDIFENMGHTIIEEELEIARKILLHGKL